jgi:hypothetical protein
MAGADFEEPPGMLKERLNRMLQGATPDPRKSRQDTPTERFRLAPITYVQSYSNSFNTPTLDIQRNFEGFPSNFGRPATFSVTVQSGPAGIWLLN